MYKGKHKSAIINQKVTKYTCIIDINQYVSTNIDFSYILLYYLMISLYLCIEIRKDINIMTKTYTYFSMVPTSNFQQQNQNNQNQNNQVLNACCVNLPVG